MYKLGIVVGVVLLAQALSKGESPATSPAQSPSTQSSAATQPVDASAVAGLIRQLGDKDNKVRDEATANLAKMGKAVLPLLKAILHVKDLDPEVAERIGRVMSALSSSEPVVKDGLSVTITPQKTVFKGREALAFRVTYTNVSKEALRLPNAPGLYNDWSVTLKDASGGVYTGHTSLPMGMRLDTAPPSEPIQPGKSIEVQIKLAKYGYSKGPWDQFNIKPVPPGSYAMCVNIEFPIAPELDNSTVTIWKNKSIQTNPVDIEIIPNKP